jgi:hypothetical protein
MPFGNQKEKDPNLSETEQMKAIDSSLEEKEKSEILRGIEILAYIIVEYINESE